MWQEPWQKLKENTRYLNGVNTLILLSGTSIIFFLSTCVIAIRNNYTNLPFWDSWDAMLSMDPNLSQITLSSFWQQHNEHRIVLARVIFYLNNTLLNGSELSLLILNLILVSIIFLLILSYVPKPDKHNKKSFIVILTAVGLLNYSLIGSQNLLWGFQSQFYLAMVLPIISFINLSRHINSGKSSNLFLSILFAVISVGSIAAGLMVFPVLILMAVLFRQNIIKIMILILFCILTFALYFKDFSFVNGSPLYVYVEHPYFVLKYVVLLLGGPIYIASGENILLTIGLVSLCLYSLCTPIFKFLFSRTYKCSSYEVINFSLMVYIMLFAIQTAGGRFSFGLSSALSSRYLLFSVVFASIASINLMVKKNFTTTSSLTFIFVILALLMPIQLNKINPQGNALFDKEVAGLALNLGVDDKAQIQSVYPWPERINSKVEVMKELDLNIFGTTEYRLQRKLLNSQFIPTTGSICVGNIENVTILGEKKWTRISGWIFSKSSKKIVVVDSENKIMGFGLIGQERPDVMALFNNVGKRSGFIAYTKILPQNENYKLLVSENAQELECKLEYVQSRALR